MLFDWNSINIFTFNFSIMKKQYIHQNVLVWVLVIIIILDLAAFINFKHLYLKQEADPVAVTIQMDTRNLEKRGVYIIKTNKQNQRKLENIADILYSGEQLIQVMRKDSCGVIKILFKQK